MEYGARGDRFDRRKMKYGARGDRSDRGKVEYNARGDRSDKMKYGIKNLLRNAIILYIKGQS